ALSTPSLHDALPISALAAASCHPRFRPRAGSPDDSGPLERHNPCRTFSISRINYGKHVNALDLHDPAACPIHRDSPPQLGPTDRSEEHTSELQSLAY